MIIKCRYEVNWRRVRWISLSEDSRLSFQSELIHWKLKWLVLLTGVNSSKWAIKRLLEVTHRGVWLESLFRCDSLSAHPNNLCRYVRILLITPLTAAVPHPALRGAWLISSAILWRRWRLTFAGTMGEYSSNVSFDFSRYHFLSPSLSSPPPWIPRSKICLAKLLPTYLHIWFSVKYVIAPSISCDSVC